MIIFLWKSHTFTNPANSNASSLQNAQERDIHEALFLTLFSGMVYNVTPYMDYHPGGEEELMKAAGIDGTELFDQVGNMRDEIKHGLLYVPFKA